LKIDEDLKIVAEFMQKYPGQTLGKYRQWAGRDRPDVMGALRRRKNSIASLTGGTYFGL
jgi:hypothetical protein